MARKDAGRVRVVLLVLSVGGIGTQIGPIYVRFPIIRTARTRPASNHVGNKEAALWQRRLPRLSGDNS